MILIARFYSFLVLLARNLAKVQGVLFRLVDHRGHAAGGVNAKIQIHVVGSPGALPVTSPPGTTIATPPTSLNTALGNIKTALLGTYYRVSAKHAQRYLSSFAWRFNCRFQLDTLTERLAYACARAAPHPYRVIIAG